jgi:hypothetical protein
MKAAEGRPNRHIMKFLTAKECENYAKRLGPKKDILDRRKLCSMRKRIDFTYCSRLKNAPPVAREIASCLGNYGSALLWTYGLVWGDRTQEPDAPQDWSDYGRWRAGLGATAPLSELPGQLFDPEERTELAEGGRFIQDRTPSCSRSRPGPLSTSLMTI